MIRKTVTILNNSLLRGIFILFLLISFQNVNAQRVGWWNFNNTSDLLESVSGYGLPLQLVGSHQLVNGPVANDHAVKIGVGSYYKMTHQITHNGGGSNVNEYTLQIDFKVESIGQWHCFFQTAPANDDDGDCFVNPDGTIGVFATTYSSQPIVANDWYRLVITVKNGSFYNYYIDGNLFNIGNVQDIDSRFSLESVLLMFADENGEDNDIVVSEIGIWDHALSAAEVYDLGGFGHNQDTGPYQISRPFLQTKTKNSIYVCWHDTSTLTTKVNYGMTESLGTQIAGSSEIISGGYRWHSVKLTGLQPDTKYFYKIITGSGNDNIYNFKTLPDDQSQGQIRFMLFSDSQYDSTATGRIVRKAGAKARELYGDDIASNINLIMHSGDIVNSGSTISSWTNEFFRPFKSLTPYIPFLSVAGNHEGESPNYYDYIKYDDISAFPSGHGCFEKIWSYRMADVMFIGLNTNILGTYGQTQIEWLDSKLQEIEDDTSIDFVFVFHHHPPWSEIWGEGNTAYVSDEIIPVLKKYPKVIQLSYGHTHAYERGVVESNTSEGDFRISCVGSGGGIRDRWGEYINYDYPQINIALDHYFFIIYDIDVASKTATGTMYDLGNNDYPLDAVVSDTWHRNLTLNAPSKPQALDPDYISGIVVLKTSSFQGEDELMSSQFQITSVSGSWNNPVLSNTRHWKDIYGVDGSFHPIDKNQGIDLTECNVPAGVLTNGNTYYYRIRYRDQNLRWSDWSDEKSFVFDETQGINDDPGNTYSFSVTPNPVSEKMTISLFIAERSALSIDLIDNSGKILLKIANGSFEKGKNDFTYDVSRIPSGIYYCRLVCNKNTITKTVNIIKN